jgi:preprotein translocase subunit SecD
MNRATASSCRSVLAILGSAVLLAGCSGERDLSGCDLEIHALAEDGSRVEPAAIDEDHVRSIARAQDAYSGERAWEVQLTPAGAAINRRFTAEQAGRPIAIVCDGDEVARPVVMGESNDTFVFIATPSD